MFLRYYKQLQPYITLQNQVEKPCIINAMPLIILNYKAFIFSNKQLIVNGFTIQNLSYNIAFI